MGNEKKTASIIFAAGKGSRMEGFDGNKTLLPLIARKSPFEGDRPILLHILDNLPAGPKALIINHKKDEIVEATRSYSPFYYEQPLLNGTGGALLASKEFIETQDSDQLIVTMGDVPFVKKSTYIKMLDLLDRHNLVVLGFRPLDKKQYGVLELDGSRVQLITEWKYWKEYPKEKQDKIDICNSGIYAARRDDLKNYIHFLKEMPHKVKKEKNGKMVEIEEFFITDLIELMQSDGLSIGYITADEENEVMGIDDMEALRTAQTIYREKK